MIDQHGCIRANLSAACTNPKPSCFMSLFSFHYLLLAPSSTILLQSAILYEQWFQMPLKMILINKNSMLHPHRSLKTPWELLVVLVDSIDSLYTPPELLIKSLLCLKSLKRFLKDFSRTLQGLLEKSSKNPW